MRAHPTIVLAALALGAACGREPTPARRPAPPAPAPVTPPPDAGSLPDLGITDPNRGLTSAERALVAPIFRDGLDYDAVRVIDGRFPFQPDGTYMTPRGHIYAPDDLFSSDFAGEADPYRQAVFVHELTHVWQYQNGMDLIAAGFAAFAAAGGDYEAAYPYLLEPGRDLVDYGMEQQASMVEDYFLIQIHHLDAARMQNVGLAPGPRDALYAAVLGRFLADPRYARAESSQDVADRHARAAAKYPPGPATCDASEATAAARHLCVWRFQRPAH